MPFTYDLSYDNSIWYPGSCSGSPCWTPVFNWGWRGVTEASTGFVSELKSDGGVDGQGCTVIIYSFTYHDPFGVPHNFAQTISTHLGGHNCITTILPRTLTTNDGSGFTLVITSLAPAGTLTSRSGSVIAAPFGTGSGAGNATDPNGNQITINNSGQFFDTLSATTPVLTVAGTAPSPTTYTYTAPAGSQHYTMNYTQYSIRTAFACSGVGEYTGTAYLVSSIVLPDSTQYTFTYEANSGRLLTVTLPTGGSITYTYTGGKNGIECADGSTSGLTRTLSPGGEWQYARTAPGSNWTTTVTSPPDPQNPGSASDVTTINFQKDSATNGTTSYYETQRVVNQGAGTALATSIICYNAVGTPTPSTCPTAAVKSPITRLTRFTYLPTATGQQAETDINYFSGTNLPTDVYSYDFGSAAVGPLLRHTQTVYAALTNNIIDHPASTKVYDGAGNLAAQTTYTYDETGKLTSTPICPQAGCTPQHVSISGSRGNLTTVTTSTSSTATLSKTFTNYDTGNPNVVTDVNGAATTFVYGAGSCGNSFATTINEPLSLSRSIVWNCTGGVATQVTDENGKTVTDTYTDPDFWRPASTLDQLANVTTFDYSPTAVDSYLTFNNGQSLTETGIGVDGLGRKIVTNHRQAPNSANWDTYPQSYDSNGRLSQVYMPCATGTWTCSTPYTSITYDSLNRPLVTTDGGGGTITRSYAKNDVLVTVGPAPSSADHVKSRQYEFDGLGRLSSVCEILASGGSPCGQSSPASGYRTAYTYSAPSAGGSQKVVTQGTQTRTYVYDKLGRLISETNPEMNNLATSYVYDTDNTGGCNSSTSKGDLASKTDANGNKICYVYDSLHRITDVIPYKNGVCYPPVKRFRYDSTSNAILLLPSGYSTSPNASGRMIEAWDGDCTWPIPTNGSTTGVDEWFAYSPRGEMTDLWASSAHIAGYYHGTASYAANGALTSLGGVPGYTTITYGLDGEGRPNTAAQGATNLVTGVTYTAGNCLARRSG